MRRQSARTVRGLFVTATDTNVGKTVLCAALLAAMRGAGEHVRAHKPVVTGLDSDEPGHAPPWPPDHELLAAAAGMQPVEVAPRRYGPAVSPHLAAALAGERIEPAQLLAAAGAAIGAHTVPRRSAIVEGVGGLLTPLADDFTNCDFAVAVGLPVLVAARPGLGTINHTLLTLRSAHDAGLEVRAVVLTPWPQRPAALERSNRDTIERLGDVEVDVLPTVPRPEVSQLALAGARLPWRRWFEAGADAARSPLRARSSI